MLDAAKARQAALGKPECDALEFRAASIVAFKSALYGAFPELPRDVTGIYRQVHRALITMLVALDPELMLENHEIYKQIEAAFFADINDPNTPKVRKNPND